MREPEPLIPVLEPGRQRHSHHLRRRPYWHQRRHRGCFSQTEYQRCRAYPALSDILHQVRNTLKYVSDKDRKSFANDLRRIYGAPSEELALGELNRAAEKWQQKYPNSMKLWYERWDAISPIFKFSSATRRVRYTTNAIESRNNIDRSLNSHSRSCPRTRS